MPRTADRGRDVRREAPGLPLAIGAMSPPVEPWHDHGRAAITTAAVSAPLRPPTDREIREFLGPRAAMRGAMYRDDGRVALASVRDGGRTVEGLVRGSEREPYRVEIELSRNESGLRCLSTCTCPIGGDCKHVAAVLFELAQRPGPDPAAPATAGVEPPPVMLNRPAVEWLEKLDSTLRRSDAAVAAKHADGLVYRLDVEWRHDGPRLLAQTLRATRSPAGVYVNERPFAIHQIATRAPPAFLRSVDVAILSELNVLASTGHAYTTRGVAITGAPGARLLEQMLRTGRCHWQAVDRPALTIAPPRPAGLEWVSQPEGGQRVDFVGEGIDAVLPVAPPWYVDEGASQCGPIEASLPPDAAAMLTTMPAVSKDEAGLLAIELARRLPDQKAPLLRAASAIRRITGPPTVRMRLSMSRLVSDRPAFGYGYGPRDEPAGLEVILAAPSLDYGGELVPLLPSGETVSRRRGGELVVVERDVEAERAVSAELRRSDFHLGRGWQSGHRLTAEQRDSFLHHAYGDESRMVSIVSDMLSRWEAAGWQIEYAPGWPYRFVDLEGEFSIDVAESSGLDWFEFDLGAMIDGERVNILPALGPLFARLAAAANRSSLAEALAELARGGARVVIGLADGRRARLPVARLLPLLTTLVELLAGSELTRTGRVRLPRLRAAELTALEGSAFEAARLRWLGGERLRELGRRLADFTAIAPVGPPHGFRGELRGYQRDGLSWLQFLRAYQLNGILADDMGLGKTVQTLGHLLLEKTSGRADRPSLVVAPTSLIPNWRLEAERFAPALRVASWHGPDRAMVDIDSADLVLTSYALLARDRGYLAGKPWHVVVLDEAQAIKNPQAIAAQVVQTLDARHRLCLTGTPLENHLGELWSLMHFLNPGLLGDRTRFGRDFRHPIEKRGDTARRDALVRRVRPFLLRRTKDAVERDLPAKTEIVERLELEPHQRDVYESVRLAAYGRVREEIAARGLARSHIVVLDALLKLRQVCCDPRLLRLARGVKGAGSAKLARLMEMLPALLEEGRRVLVFSQFTSMLALIESALTEAGIDYVILTGDTIDRTKPVKRFQTGEVPVFLISLKAGGVGLNLTAADTVILYDPWWNPAVEAQAIDRAHRIGQDKPVFAYRFLTIGTVEEKMLELQGRKRALAEALLSGSPTASSQITEADLESLFAPLDAPAAR